jgi:hypothetical protein
MPYICILDDCLKSSDVFRTFEDWVLHMQTEHRVIQWRCFAPSHGPQSFDSEKSYERHIHEHHPGTFAPSELPALTRMSLRSTFQIFSLCPFCDFLPDEAKNTSSITLSNDAQDSLQRHVATHMEELSLISLRWLDVDDDIDSTESVSLERMDKVVRNSDDHPQFDDPPVRTSSSKSDVDPDWNGSLPKCDSVADDPAWISWLGPRDPKIPSLSEEWPFRWKSILDSASRKSLVSVDSSAEVADNLAAELNTSKWEWPLRANSYFIPINEIENRVEERVVRTALRGIYSGVDQRRLDAAAHRICNTAQRLFTVLLCASKGAYRSAILDFIEDNVTDADLPLARVYLKASVDSRGRMIYTLGRKSHEYCPRSQHDNCGINCLSSWRPSNIEELCRDQWLVLAPVFKTYPDFIEHHNLDSSIILPYIEDQETDEKLVMYGGYSEMWGVRIHPAHQRLLDARDPSVRQKSRKQRKELMNVRGQ